MDTIGLITITYNSEKVLKPFLDCVWKQTYTNLILYVIDNASTDSSLVILKQEKDSRLRLIENNKNLGVAKANNQGIQLAISEGCSQVMIINNDVEFEERLIDKLIEVQVQKKCGLVAPKMMYYDKPNYIWYAGGLFIKQKGYLPIHRGLKQLDEDKFNHIIKVNYAPTCCLLIKKEVFCDVGLMDERYFVYFDDTDFLYRVWKTEKHTLYYCPNIKFYHKVGSLTQSFNNHNGIFYRGDFFLKHNTRNHVYFLKKIGGLYCYLFIIWLFFKNNLRFIFSHNIRKSFSTWKLINNAYFEGLKM